MTTLVDITNKQYENVSESTEYSNNTEEESASH